MLGTLRCAQVFVDMVATKRLSLAPSISTFDRRFAGVAARHALRVARCLLRGVPLGVAGGVLQVAGCRLHLARCTLSAVRRMMRVRSVASALPCLACRRVFARGPRRDARSCAPALHHQAAGARNPQHATCNTQHATRNVRGATSNMQCATHNVQIATYNVRRATRNVQRATRNMQLASALAATMRYFYSRACTPMAAD